MPPFSAFFRRLVPAFIVLFFSLPFGAKAQNDVIMQGFYWNTNPGDLTDPLNGGVWWDTLRLRAPILADAGFKTVWTPPANKGFAGTFDMGYGVHDYFDYGRFNQNGATRTRHGNWTEFQAMMNGLHAEGLKVMGDVVLNHRAGASTQQPEHCDHNNDNILELRYTNFQPASNRLPMDATAFHPTATHCDLNPPYHDRLFFEDLCYFHGIDGTPPEGGWFYGPHNLGYTGDSLISWGRDMINNIGFDELRLDAVKHVEPGFLAPFLVELKNGAQPYAVGELFDYDLGTLKSYHDQVESFVSTYGTGSKDANLAIFDFNLRGVLRDLCNANGSYNMWNLNSSGLRFNPAGGLPGEDIVTFVENHDVDRVGWQQVSCAGPYQLQIGGTCLALYTDGTHDAVFKDKEDMAYPYIMAAEGRPCVFWKDWFWFGMDDDLTWQIALRNATASGNSTPIQSLNPFFTAGNGGDLFVLTRDGASAATNDGGLVFAVNDNNTSEAKVFVNTPFQNVYLKDYSDSYLFQFTQAYNDTRAEVKAQSRDYSWWAPTGLYPKSPATGASHFNMDATPGGAPHFVALRVADAANLLVNGAPIAAGDEVAVKNAAGKVVGIGRIGQTFQWDGVHDMIIEVLGAPSTDGMFNGEQLHFVVWDQSAAAEVNIDFVQFAAVGNNFTFSTKRPNSPNRNGNFASFSLTASATGLFAKGCISRVLAFVEPVAVNIDFCSDPSQANASVYNNGLQTGDNDGTGFLGWTSINVPGNGSFGGIFIGSSTANNAGSDSNGDGDINTGGEAWGFYANTNNIAEAVRPFAAPLAPEAIFSIRMDNGGVDGPFGSVGFGLQNASGQNLMEFYFRQGQANYKIKDRVSGVNETEFDTGIPFNREGFKIDVELLSASTYKLTVTRLSNGTVFTFYSRSLNTAGGGQSIDRVRVFNFNAGGLDERNAYFNDFRLCYPPALVINEIDYDQPGVSDGVEFIEIKNVSGASIDLSQYQLELLGTPAQTVNLSGALAAGAYHVVCNSGSGVNSCDQSFTGAADQINDGPASVRLRRGAITVDSVAYEGTGVTPGDNNTTAGIGLSRVPDGTDSDVPSDWELTCVTPGAHNTSDNADTDMDGTPDFCDACPLAVDHANIPNFNAAACACNTGYYAQTEVRNGQTVITGCNLCPAGSYCPDGVQQLPCEAGSYSSTTGAASCTACGVGTYSSTTGSTSCTACAAGTYQSQTGQTSCLACGLGTYSSTTGSANCTACAAGYYQDQTAQTSCLACAVNTHAPNEGSALCTACGSGFYAPEASANCSLCAVTFTATPTSESCPGQNDGQIVVTAPSGGTPPFEYAFELGAFGPTATFTGLGAGTYQVRVRDFYLCESSQMVMVGASTGPAAIGPTSYCSIQQALDAVGEGATIVINAGTYAGCVTVAENAAFQTSGGPLTIDCLILNGAGKVLTLNSDLTINNLTLTAGRIRTNGYKLTVSQVSGGSLNGFIVTD